jgi:Tol biopolymer transport system component
MNDQIGPYQIIREIGRGGMGVVHLARDTRLDRDVAIKELPEDFAQDPTRLERFEREARALASLDHANLASIYGVEEQEGAKYLVLEYIEGETLADRLDRGALPLDEALELAVQIAAGVGAAHEAGIIHRDLKPDNIKITPEGKAKVLDFGLARADETGTSTSGSGDTATRTAAQRTPTIEGAILGTAAYMSPEQARGRRVDKRTDLWSYGVVLYEMLVGASPFHGETASDSIGAVLHKEIDLNLLPAGTPPMVRHVLVRCLERNREQRYRDIGDVRIELERARTEPQSDEESGTRRLPRAAIAVVALAMAVVGAVGGWLLRPQPERTPLHVAVPLAERFENVWGFRLSPDGETLAIVARERVGENESVDAAVYVRTWSEPTFRKLPETDRANSRSLAFTPSGEHLLVQVHDELRPRSERRMVPLAGGPSVKLYSIEQGGLLSWRLGFGPEDEIVVQSTDGKELYRVRRDGGTPELITPLTGRGDRYMNNFKMPDPGGRYLVANAWSPSTKSIALYRIDLESGECSEVLENAAGARFLPGGYLAFARDQSLWIAPFDPDTAQVTGPATGYLSDVGRLSLDRSGERVVFTTRDKSRERSEIVVVDEADRVLETLLTVPGLFQDVAAVSPDGRRLAYLYNRDEGRQLWVLDIPSGLTRQVSSEGGFPLSPEWLPDGRLAYTNLLGGGGVEPMVIDAVPGMSPQPLLPRAGDEPFKAKVTGISPDGRHALCESTPPDGRAPGIYLFDVGDGDSARAFYASEQSEGEAKFRPDGKWVAYSANGTGRMEVYLRPFVAENPESAPIHPVTRLGGGAPLWSPDGRTLYYWGIDAEQGQVFAVTVETEPELKMDGVNWIVPMPEGRILKLQDTLQGAGDVPEMRAILNWGLTERIAAQQ